MNEEKEVKKPTTVEIGIPVYKARDTLPALLDSLVAQTDKNFEITMCADGEGDLYKDIVRVYTARGLKIRYISLVENRGPGMVRQCILDNSKADYIISVMLMMCVCRVWLKFFIVRL